ncbi:hypothetical protein [Herpetosiphon geysericola]|uniref:Uncharacterized protein n=1 Tax=Herpetosiphon geysericola TaxID=70996 RepID=A0A0P6XZ80_9CHLR|nr:hypothetical protein [Herpetosiphon geysericola]KPL90212.1 hypothetical protein SE18_08405 [Herpetosiphon geysericola]
MRRWLGVGVGVGLIVLVGMVWFAFTGFEAAEPRRAVYRGSGANVALWGDAFTKAGVLVQSTTDPLPTDSLSILYLDAEALNLIDLEWLRTQYGRETMIVGVDVQAIVLSTSLNSPLTADNLALREDAIITSTALKINGMFKNGESLGVSYSSDISRLISETQEEYRSSTE